MLSTYYFVVNDCPDEHFIYGIFTTELKAISSIQNQNNELLKIISYEKPSNITKFNIIVLYDGHYGDYQIVSILDDDYEDNIHYNQDLTYYYFRYKIIVDDFTCGHSCVKIQKPNYKLENMIDKFYFKLYYPIERSLQIDVIKQLKTKQ
jgi:hypothetical protein